MHPFANLFFICLFLLFRYWQTSPPVKSCYPFSSVLIHGLTLWFLFCDSKNFLNPIWLGILELMTSWNISAFMQPSQKPSFHFFLFKLCLQKSPLPICLSISRQHRFVNQHYCLDICKYLLCKYFFLINRIVCIHTSRSPLANLCHSTKGDGQILLCGFCP